MPRRYSLLLAGLLPLAAAAQTTDPAVTSWLLNTTSLTGFNGLPANVQQVRYSTGSVYVSCSNIPAYTIGPWPSNPNTATNQNFVFRLTRTPAANTGTATATPLGHIGLWRNGVSMFNAKDAMSYQNQGIWNQNAITVEGPSFDACLGHPAPGGEYHHHLNPKCLYNDRDSSRHSPIIGYAFDGYPIYGTYGYRNANGTGGIKSIKSSYRKRSITARTTRPDGSALTATQYGPAVNTAKPLGYYIEDYDYLAGRGDLDAHNGRFGVTPEYPQGTYAYFVTLNSLYEGAYPYNIGPTYYGVVPAGSIGPQSGHVTVTEPVTTYVLTARLTEAGFSLSCTPNPASNLLTVQLRGIAPAQPFQACLLNILGQPVGRPATLVPGTAQALDVSGLAAGVYFLWVEGNGLASAERVLIAR